MRQFLFVTFLSTIFISFQIDEQSKDIISFSELENFSRKIGEHDLSQNELDSIFIVVEKAIKSAIAKKDSLLLGKLLGLKANIKLYKGNSKEALPLYFEAIKISTAVKDTTNLKKIYINLGVQSIRLKTYTEALSYLKISLDLGYKTNDISIILACITNMRVVYSRLNDAERGMFYLLKADSIINQVKSFTELNFSAVSVKMGLIDVHIANKEYKRALILAKKNIELLNKITPNNDFGKYYVFEQLGSVYYLNKMYSKSEEMLLKAYALAEKLKAYSFIKNCSHSLLNLYIKIGKPEQAVFYFSEYDKAIDSIYSKETTKLALELNTQYETDKKDKEIILNETELLKKSKENNKLIALIAFLVTGLVSLFVFYKQQQKVKGKEIERILFKNKLARLGSIIDGEEKERSRIAFDLHDGIIGNLAVIKYKITTIDFKNISLKNSEYIHNAIEMLDDSAEQIRKLSHNLAPPALKELNLIEAVELFCNKFFSVNEKITLSFQTYGKLKKLDTKVETAIYRIIQELLNNVLKHAKATDVLIEINCQGENIHIIVEDDGVGFDISDAEIGIGLKNIKSRIAFLNADFDIDSNSKGTTATIKIDLSNL